MMEPLDLMLVGAALALSLTLLRKWLISSKRRLPLPPGPRGLPFFGNIFDLPKGVFWETYHEWATRYGTDIIYLDMLGSPAIIIDSYKAAHELVDLRSSNYASRPELPMMVDLMGFGWHVGFMPYGTKWREHRKIMHQYFETSYRLKFRPAISNITKTLLQNLLNSPDDFTDHMRLQAGSYIMFVAYGIDIKSRDDPHLQRAERAMYAMGQAGHGYIVDHFPSLKILPAWCPGAQFRVDARKWRPDIEDMANIPFEIVKSRFAQGIARPCIATDLLEKVSHETDLDKVRHEEEKIRNILVSSYSVGSDTLVSPLLTFVLAMTMYPEVQRKAQAEIDKVLGGERLPEFSDFGKIPYIDAMLKELVRWKPTVPLGVQYSVIAEDIYNGYHIPAGSTVYVNAWAMLQDEATYGPETHHYRPERFLDAASGELNKNVKEPSEAFGFGRRFCPGVATAKDLIWMTIASVLATFDIKRAVGAEGIPIQPSGEFTPTFVSHPVAFPCVIVPRSPRHTALVHAAQLDTMF